MDIQATNYYYRQALQNPSGLTIACIIPPMGPTSEAKLKEIVCDIVR